MNRLSLDQELEQFFPRMAAGTLLDVGAKASPYRNRIKHTRYVRLDANPRHEPDVCSDIHDFTWDGEPFDSILALEILEHLREPQRALDRIHDALAPGGTCLVSTRFLYRYHPDPEDHYRFTWDSLRHLFRRFSRTEIHHHGNRLQVLWEIMNAGGRSRVVLNLLNTLVARVRVPKTRFPLGFVVFAVK